jgi:hypothetical protein
LIIDERRKKFLPLFFVEIKAGKSVELVGEDSNQGGVEMSAILC